ncbi:MAG: hypothetical protein E7430_05055 [Ruminococcaceae bacterium]|nr:hypothetical protein [Oscillospiraceae bacterium]
MQFTYPLFSGDDETGFISVKKDGLRLYLEAQCKHLEGIHRAWAVSGDERLLIGVLIPEGDSMGARKVYNISSIGAFDVSRITHGDTGAPQHNSSWQRCRNPGSLFADDVAKTAFDMGFEYFARSTETGKVITVPWKGGRFPMPGLFCLCSVECINGRQMVVIRVDGEGNLCV